MVSGLRSRLVQTKKPGIDSLHRRAQWRILKGVIRNHLASNRVHDRMSQTGNPGLIDGGSPKKSDPTGSDICHLQHCVAYQFVLHTAVEMLKVRCAVVAIHNTPA